MIGDDVLLLGLLAIMGYIAVTTKGKASEAETITRETMKDGRIKVTHQRRVTYVNPFSALDQLLAKFWPEGK